MTTTKAYGHGVKSWLTFCDETAIWEPERPTEADLCLFAVVEFLRGCALRTIKLYLYSVRSWCIDLGGDLDIRPATMPRLGRVMAGANRLLRTRKPRVRLPITLDIHVQIMSAFPASGNLTRATTRAMMSIFMYHALRPSEVETEVEDALGSMSFLRRRPDAVRRPRASSQEACDASPLPRSDGPVRVRGEQL